MTDTLDTWTITPITGVFGAELSGAYVRDGVDPTWLSALLEDQRLLVLRDQHLTHGEQVELARALGEPTVAHPVIPGHPDFPEILEQDGAKGGRNARWHTDVTFAAVGRICSSTLASRRTSSACRASRAMDCSPCCTST